MTSRRPVSELHDALGEFGRRGKKLSVARLEEFDAVLKVVGTPEQLNDEEQRRALAASVYEALRSTVESLDDPVDSRIAQAVLATEPEFHDKTVEERKAIVRENDRGFTDEQYKDRRRRVIGDIEEALRMAIGTGVDATTSPASRTTAGRRRHILAGAAVVALLAVVAVAVIALTRDDTQATWNGVTAVELERRYDGKLPWGDDDISRCADPPDSEEVVSNSPPVIAPDGNQVGVVQLRKSPICQTATWSRVLWDGDERKRYQIPTGWTLHTVMHRPATNTVIDEQDHSTASEAPYIVSRMISSARGCVYAEVYFASDDNPDAKTATARTSCVQL